ncbi:cupin domain-containing protein [Candidatus Woesearchaeota archaeon]|nr:cupin domain-containing protein [Candidatus Woesearchaeota archaeon]
MISIISKKQLGNHKDERGMLLWISQKLLNFDFKYISIGSIKPGHKRGGHYHKETYEQFMCIAGRIKFVRDDESIVLEAGDIVEIPLGAVHVFINEGKETAYFLEMKSIEFDEQDNYLRLKDKQ